MVWRLGIAAAFAAAMLAQDPVFREDVTLLLVSCSVTDTDGSGSGLLRAEDFQVFVDGAREEVRGFWREPDLPLTLAIIMDVSESQRSRISEHEAAVQQFLNRVIRPGDKAYVVAVDDRVLLKTQVRGTVDGLRAVVLPPRGEELGVPCGNVHGERGRVRPVCGGTALWNGVYAISRLKLNGSGNKALVILSDGIDTGSTHPFADALREVELSGAVVYASQRANDLDRLTSSTGGMSFDGARGDYSRILAQVETDMRNQYVVGIRPSAKPGTHSLRVEVARPGIIVRARNEYISR